MRVALTFDAEHPDRRGSAPGGHEDVLALLRREGAPATFFLQGRWAQAYPETARRMVADGHAVGSHSHFHARMPLLSEEGLGEDIARAESAIREATGVDPRPWFRCPWGDGARDPRVGLALRRRGYRHVGWDVVAEDWEPERTAEDVAMDVLEAVGVVGDGAVVLLHTWCGSTVGALPTILTGLRKAGAKPVTVGDLADRDLEATPDPGTVGENPTAPGS